MEKRGSPPGSVAGELLKNKTVLYHRFLRKRNARTDITPAMLVVRAHLANLLEVVEESIARHHIVRFVRRLTDRDLLLLLGMDRILLGQLRKDASEL